MDRLSFEVGTEAEQGCGMDPPGASATAGKLRLLERRILVELRGLLGEEGRCALPEEQPLCQPARAVPAMLATRLLVGSCCEAYAALACSRRMHPTGRQRARAPAQSCRRLYEDSLHAAAWTSSHARFVSNLHESGISAALPTVHSVPSELSEWEMGDLYARRVHTKSVFSKECLSAISLLARCTNPGCRGWDSVVKSGLEKSDGARRVAISAIGVSVTGMHSYLHPALRLHWTKRHALIHSLSSTLTTNGLPALAAAMLGPFKEAMRRFTRNCISGEHATLAALARLDHPVALLKQSALHMPNPGLEAACSAFAHAGEALVLSRFESSVASCVNAAFERYSSGIENGRLQWTPAFLGKGNPSVASRSLAVDVAADAFSAAHRCNFFPFWSHGSSHRLRVSRLGHAQHAAIHDMNAASRLTLLLGDEQRMELNRLALAHASSGILTLHEAAELLGASAQPEGEFAAGSRGPEDAVNALGQAGPRQAARLLSFCRMAHIADSLLIYDLGERVARLQARALARRTLIDEQADVASVDADPFGFLRLVPNHSKNIFACVECRRVSNAHVEETASARGMQPFTELGTSSSMVAVDPRTREMHLRCAKRCSASVRSAVAFEEDMQSRGIEEDEPDWTAVDAMISSDVTSGDAAASTRARRDAKVTLEQRQRATPCGSENMLCIPIVGKAVRLWGDWFALCSLCGALVRFHPCSRVGSDICCLRCDPKMLFRKEKHENVASSVAPACRYCGKVRCSTGPVSHAPRSVLADSTLACLQVDPQRTGAKWRCCRAPHDISGTNASLPPPLRKVYFCPLHFRSWIPACLKTMPTRVILSHVVFGAKPCFGMGGEEDEQLVGPNKASKRRRLNTRS